MEEYRALAEGFKDEGNECFQSGDIDQAIQLYTQAIDLDPDNCTYYSNRSAAYMKADSKSKALKDAEKCVELNPSFVKGYSRLGVAQQALKRYENAIDTFKKGIELDANNQSLWAALVACQEKFQADKKERFAEAEQERQREDDYQRRKEAARERATAAAAISGLTEEVEAEPDESDLLNSFLSEVTSSDALKVPKRVVVPDEELDKELQIHDKYANQDLGKGVDQVMRLTGPNYQFKNLNPYSVLQLDIDATEEDIKNRYRKLSTRIHPDKLRDEPNAREAFEEVKKAYQRLCEPEQKANVVRNMEYIKSEVQKERRRLISKGVKEADLPFATFEEEYEVRLFKHFADIEMQRRRSETNIRSHNARERLLDDEERTKMMKQAEKEDHWADVERREKRVGTWRDFQDEAALLSKKAKISSFKEDTRSQVKHGVVKLNEWKKSWK